MKFLSQILILSKGQYEEDETNSSYKRYTTKEILEKANEVNYKEFWKENIKFNFKKNVKFLQLKRSENDSWVTIDWLLRFSNGLKGSEKSMTKNENFTITDFYRNENENRIGLTAHCSYHKYKLCGWFNSLYCWIRMLSVNEKGYNQQKAYKFAQKIMQTKPYIVTETTVKSSKIKNYKYLPVYKCKQLKISGNIIPISIWYFSDMANIYFKLPNDDERYITIKRNKIKKEETVLPVDINGRQVEEVDKKYFIKRIKRTPLWHPLFNVELTYTNDKGNQVNKMGSQVLLTDTALAEKIIEAIFLDPNRGIQGESLIDKFTIPKKGEDFPKIWM